MTSFKKNTIFRIKYNIKSHNYILRGLVFIILIFIAFKLFPHNNIKDKIITDFNFQLTFALMTAIFTTTMFNTYNSIINYYNIKRYEGYWMVLKFNNENYTKLDAYVSIELKSNDTLVYNYTDLKRIDEINGTIFINKNNKKTGKLISRFEWCNQESKLHPIQEYSIYFDNDTNHFKNPTSVIRIIHLNGNEYISLIRPIDQKLFLKEINRTYCETASKMYVPCSDY